METQKILEWLRTHDLIKIQYLEKLCNMPKDTLRQAIKGRQPLPEKYLYTMRLYLSEYGYA